MYDGDCLGMYCGSSVGLFFSGDFGKGNSGRSSALVEES